MTDTEDLLARASAMQQKLQEVHKIKGKTWKTLLRKARGSLPRRVIKDARSVAECLPMIGHPKLERLIDYENMRAAQTRVMQHLDSVDVAQIRRDRFLRMFGLLAFNVILVAALFLYWMVSTGQL